MMMMMMKNDMMMMENLSTDGNSENLDLFVKEEEERESILEKDASIESQIEKEVEEMSFGSQKTGVGSREEGKLVQYPEKADGEKVGVGSREDLKNNVNDIESVKNNDVCEQCFLEHYYKNIEKWKNGWRPYK